MKTFVECSQIIIWVPTKERGICNSAETGVKQHFRNECIASAKKRSNVNSLRQQFDGTGHNNPGFTIEDTSNESGARDNSKRDTNLSRNEIKILPQEEIKEKKRTSNQNDDFEVVLFDLLDAFKVKPRTLRSHDDNYMQFSFCLENYKIEQLILLLQKNGIGSTPNTSVSVIPVSIHLEVPSERLIGIG